MAITFTITDNANGTVAFSGTATPSVSGCTLFYCPFSQTSMSTWTSLQSGFSLTSTPTTYSALTLAAGVYWFRVVAASDGSTTLVYKRVTNGEESVHYKCLTGVQTVLQSLALTSIDSDSIEVLKMPETKALQAEKTEASKLPGILICPIGTEKMTGGTNTRDDIGYPVSVFIVAKDDRDLRNNINLYTRWRQLAIKALRDYKSISVSEVHRATIEPAPIIHPGAWNAGMLVSAFTVRYLAREARGTS